LLRPAGALATRAPLPPFLVHVAALFEAQGSFRFYRWLRVSLRPRPAQAPVQSPHHHRRPLGRADRVSGAWQMVVCSVSCVLGSHQGAVGFVAIKSCSRPPHALDATPAISEPSCCHMPCSTAQQAPPQAPGRRRAASSSPLGSPWRRPLTAGRASLWALVARVRGKVYVNAVSLRAPLSLPFSIDAPHCWPAGGAAVDAGGRARACTPSIRQPTLAAVAALTIFLVHAPSARCARMHQ
jgi:hypothetical protein